MGLRKWCFLVEDLRILFLYLAFFTYPFSILLNSICFGLYFIFLLIIIIKDKKYMINWKIIALYLLPTYFFFKVLIDSIIIDEFNNIFLEKYAAFLFFPVLGYLDRNYSKNIFKTAGKAIFVAGLSLTLICLFLHLRKFIVSDLSFNYFFNWEYAKENITNPIGIHTTYAGLLSLFSLIIYFYDRGNKNVIISFIIYTTVIVFLVLIGSRAILICFLIFCFYQLISKSLVLFKNRTFYKLIILIVLFCSVIYLTYNEISIIKWRFREIAYNLNEDDYSKVNAGALKTRLIMWECTVKEYLNSNLLFGANINNSKNELIRCYKDVNFYFGAEKKYGPHNQYLSTLLNFGLIGVAIILFFLIIGLLLFRKNKTYFWLAIFFCVSFLVEEMLTAQKGIVFWLFLSVYSLNFSIRKKQFHLN